MKKCFLFLSLLPLVCYADPLPGWAVTIIQAGKTNIWQASGSYYITVKNPVSSDVYCWAISQSDLNAVPTVKTPLEVVAANTTALTPVQLNQCFGTPLPPPPVVSWVVSPNPAATDVPPTRPMKTETLTPITARILVGAPCESTSAEPVSVLNSTQQYRHATNSSGVRAVTLCNLK